LRATTGYEKEYRQYSEISTKLNQQYDREKGENKIPERIEEKYLDWPSILKSRENVKNIKDMAIFSLYTEVIPRRGEDYQYMKLKRKKPGFNEDKLDINYNYLILNKKGTPVKLIFQKGKNDVKYPTLKRGLSDRLKGVLIEYIKQSKLVGENFLFPKDDTMNKDHLSQSAWSTLVGDTMEKITGKRAGIQILRTSYASWFCSVDRSYNELSDLAKSMGNRVDTILKHYVVKN
jgi:hypothetical protein